MDKGAEKLDGWLQRADLGWLTLERKVRTSEPGDPGQLQLAREEVADLEGMTPHEVIAQLVDEEHLVRGGSLQMTAHFVNEEGTQKYLRRHTFRLVREGWGTRTAASAHRGGNDTVLDSAAAMVDAVGLRNDNLIDTLMRNMVDTAGFSRAAMDSRLTDHTNHHTRLMEALGRNTALEMRIWQLENTGLGGMLEKLSKTEPKFQEGILNMSANIAGKLMTMLEEAFSSYQAEGLLRREGLKVELIQKRKALDRPAEPAAEPTPAPVS